MKNLKCLYVAFFVLSPFFAHAAKVDTVITFSKAMKKEIKAIVIVPDAYSDGKNYPVLYLLHGAGGSYAEWVNKVPNIKYLADLHKMIIVCPDGNVTSWYFDSPIDPSFKYETYVAIELVKFMDEKYKTIQSRTGRAISGLSMGGHGAFYLGIKHQNVYGAVGSMSGGVDILPFPNGWDLPKRLGTQNENLDNWKNNSVINLIPLLKTKSLAITFECGTSDFFFAVNEHLHQELLYRNIAHDYTTRPGGHTWEYWANAIKYQSQFFDDFFKSGK